MAVYITGDIHGNPNRLSSERWPLGKELTKDDTLIILGDFGLVWSAEESEREMWWLGWLNSKPWTTVFIDGNHENHERLATYPVAEWKGGKVHKLRDSVFHLMRGEVFTIEGKKFFAMGGASSHDIQNGILDPADYADKDELRAACKKLEDECGGWRFAMYRIKGIDWWPEEIPSIEEKRNGLKNLAQNNCRVDFVLTHEAPASDVAFISNGWYHPDNYSHWLEELRQSIYYDKWCFGHYHMDKVVNSNDAGFYEDIIQVL